MLKILFSALLIISSPVLLRGAGSLLKLNNKEFRSTNLTFTPQVTLYLPAGYQKSGKKYPVLYALDGQNLFDNKTAFSGEWQLDENIEALQKKGLLDDIIVVGVHNTSRRMYDYTPSLAKTKEFGELGGDLDKFGRFLVQELKPYIDKNFPVLTDRLHTGIMGSSLGGLSSFYLLGWYPQVFSRAGVISPSFWWDQVRVTNDLQAMKFPSDVRIYIDGGWREGADESSMVRYMRLVYQELKKKGLKDLDNLFYFEDPEGTHSETFWARRGKMPLLYLFGRFASAPQKLSIHLDPSILVMGKSSRLLYEAELPHDMRLSLLSPALKITPSGSARLQQGSILPLQEGPFSLSVSQFSFEQVFSLRVFPDIPGMIHRQIIIESAQPLDQAALLIEEYNGAATNLRLPLTPQGTTRAMLYLSLPKDTKIRFLLQDSRGRTGHSRSGKQVQKSLTFRKNDSFTVEVQDWK